MIRRTSKTRLLATTAILASAALPLHPALADPAVYFNADLNAGLQSFLDTAAAADAAYEAANPNTTQDSLIFQYDLSNITGYRFAVTDNSDTLTVWVETTRLGSPAINDESGDEGGEGFTGWSVGYTAGDWSSVVAAGYKLSFYADSTYTTPYDINAVGLHVSDWGTCCTSGNTTPTGTANASQIYMLFNGSTPLLVGGIDQAIGGEEHFVAAIDDRNAFSSVTLAPNGSGEFFGAGSYLVFSTLQIGSVPAGSSVVTVGGGNIPIEENENATPETVDDGTYQPIFDGGTLAFDSNYSYATDLSVTGNGGTIDTGANLVTLTGDLTDETPSSGALIKIGAGTLTLAGANTFSGGWVIDEGTLAGTTSTILGDVETNANLLIDQDVDGTFAGDVSGTGALTKDGEGNVTLTGLNSYTGGTAILGGTLTGDTGSLTGDVLNNAALVIDQDTDGTFGGDVSGTGSLTKDGDGNVTLTGSNSYAGGTAILGGTLTGDTDALTGDVSNNAALVIDQDTDGTFAGDVSGTGSLTKDGDGNVTLTGGNSYTGGTSILGGTLTGDTDALTGDVLNNAALVIDQDTDGTFGGDVSGIGSLTKDGDGNVTLTGSNSYTGGTSILGGTLTGDTDALTGDVSNNAVLVIDQDIDGTFGGDVSGTGSLTKDGDGNVTLTGANSYTGGTSILGGTLTGSTTSIQGDVLNNAVLVIDQGHTGTFGGDISGTGVFVKNGAGTVTLTGSNSYGGGTVILDGTLRVSTQTLPGDVENDGTLLFVQDVDGTFAGSVVGVGSLVKDGDGNVTLTGSNTYTGGTTILGGTLTGDTDALTGNVLNNAALVIDQDVAGTFAGDVSGSGSLTKNGDGNVTLTGSNSYTGGTTILGGTLTGDTDALTGNVVNNAALIIDQDVAGTFAGDVSGSGSLTKLGDGNVTLTGSNGYAGGTTILGGTLTGDTDALTGNVLNNAALVIDQHVAGTFAGDVSGSGSLTKRGVGNVTLTGSNTYTGGTTILGGTLTGDTNSLTGLIVNSAALVIDQDHDATFDGTLSGSGSVTKSGDGIVTIDGVHTLTGTTTIAGGALAITGDYRGSSVIVEGVTALYGDGIVGGLIVRTNGELAIGDAPSAMLQPAGMQGSQALALAVAPVSIDTLQVAGNALFETGSLYTVDVDAAGNSDLLAVSGALTIEGGTVSVIAADGDYAWQTVYTIATAGSRTGMFAGAEVDNADYDPTLRYTPTQVQLVLTRNDLDFADAGETANQIAAGTGFTGAFAAGSPEYFAFASLNGAGAADVLDGLSGEVHGSVANAAWQDSAQMRRAVMERGDLPRSEGPELWLQIQAGRQDWDGDGNAAGYDRDTMAYVGGLEWGFGQSKLGVAIGYSDGDMTVGDRASSASIKGTHGHLYAGTDVGALRLFAGASYADLDIETERGAGIASIAQTLAADYDAKAYGLYGTAGVLLPVGKGAIEPFVGVNWTKFDRDGFAETGGSLALAADDAKEDWTFGSLGVKGHVTLDAADTLAFRFVTEWQHALNGRGTGATLAFDGGPDFAVAGAPLAKDAGLVDVGLHWRAAKGLGIGLSYGGTVAKQGVTQTGRATVSLRF